MPRKTPRRRGSPSIVGGDDAASAIRFATGDPDAVREMYGRYGKLVYAVAYRVLRDARLAEDATQQTFVQARRAADGYNPARPVGAWLAAMAVRVAIDLERRGRGGGDTLETPDFGPVTVSPSAQQILVVWEVRRALADLPEQDRELIRLQRYAGLTHTEIAQRLAIPLETVISRSHRAHGRLTGVLDGGRNAPKGSIARSRGKSLDSE